MSSVTPKLGLTLPVGSEKVSRQIINNNMSIIDTFCGDINKSTLREVPFAIAVSDWTSSAGRWGATFDTAYVTASSKEIGYYDSSLESYAKAHIIMSKKSGGGGLVFDTAKKPTGTITGTVLVFDNDDNKIPIIVEGTVVPIANGGTGQSSLAGAKSALGITALADQIATNVLDVGLTGSNGILATKSGNIIVFRSKGASAKANEIRGSVIPQGCRPGYDVCVPFNYYNGSTWVSDGKTILVKTDGTVIIQNNAGGMDTSTTFNYSSFCAVWAV